MMQVPSATLAVTHDSQWTTLLERVRHWDFYDLLNVDRIIPGNTQP